MTDQEMVATAKDLRASGLGYRVIGDIIGKSDMWVRYRLDPAFAEEQRERNRGKTNHTVKKLRYEAKPQFPPYDTRDLTGRLCGDPLPGRSALDQKRLAEPLPIIDIAEPIE